MLQGWNIVMFLVHSWHWVTPQIGIINDGMVRWYRYLSKSGRTVWRSSVPSMGSAENDGVVSRVSSGDNHHWNRVANRWPWEWAIHARKWAVQEQVGFRDKGTRRDINQQTLHKIWMWEAAQFKCSEVTFNVEEVMNTFNYKKWNMRQNCMHIITRQS